MDRFIKRANTRISLGGAAALLISTSMFGQILGFLRIKLVNANFSALGPQSTDAYFAAFKIPDFFFFTLAAGALGVAFMPILSDHIHRGDRKGVWDLTSSLMNLLTIIMAGVAVIILIFAPQLLHYIVAPKLTPEQLHNAASIMRLIALNPLLFTLSGILVSVQQTYGRFFFYAIAPLFYNASIIMSIFVFKNNWGLIGLGLGALIGALLQLTIAFLGIAGMGFKYWPKINWRSSDFRLILKQLPPRSVDQGIDSINSIVETNFARRLGEGNISFYENAYMLHTAPILLIGTSVSTAAFPRLTARLSQNRPDLFRKEFLQVLRAMVWIIMPVVVISYFARGYLARLIFAKDAPEIALIFGYLTGAIFFRTIYAIISRYFYAHKDTKTPLFVSLFAIGLNILLAWRLSRSTSYGVAGLALAESFVALGEVVILSLVMVVRDPKLLDKTFWGGIVRILSVTGFSVLAAFIMVSILPLNIADRGFVTLGTKLTLIAGVTILVHVSISYLFDLEEARPIIDKLKRIILRPIKVQL
ncbi:MAG: integral rane protein MviN [Candidatus Saccharibacteria bacterium]|nr:integral rane protein MviN [Candidatus Saccharibacteria bacterium]